MFELQTLGVVGLRASGEEVSTATIVQPKRLAILVFLALAPRRRLRRRDQLLGLFWPELDDLHGRGALSQALKYLRKALGPGVIVTQGEEEVGVDGSRIQCDAAAVREAFESGNLDVALARYTGAFLAGFHVGEASAEYDEWVAGERSQLAQLAATAARRLADRAEQQDDLAAAASWAREAARVSPDDERAVAKLIQVLDRSGDRAGALRAYETLRKRLRDEFGVSPSRETEGLVTAIRGR